MRSETLESDVEPREEEDIEEIPFREQEIFEDPSTTSNSHPKSFEIFVHWLRKPFLQVLLSILISSIFLLLSQDEKRPLMNRAAFVGALMTINWCTEALPMLLTSLLPLILFPFLSISSASSVSSSYFNDNVFLTLGTFLLGLALAQWKTHLRIALRLLLLVGNRPFLFLLALILSTAFLSMWMSNTSCVTLMCPLAITIIEAISPKESEVERSMIGLGRQNALKTYATCLLIGIAYSSTIGGFSTIVGTGTNVAFLQQLYLFFPKAPSITFPLWMGFALPLSFLLLLFTWGIFSMYLGLRWRLTLQFPHFPTVNTASDSLKLSADVGDSYSINNDNANPPNTSELSTVRVQKILWMFHLEEIEGYSIPEIDVDSLRRKYDDLKAITYEGLAFFPSFSRIQNQPIALEKMTVLALSILAFLWITREGFGEGSIFPGWGGIFHGNVGDGTLAMLVAFGLFIIPTSQESQARGNRKTILEVSESFAQVKWHILFLIGSGFALSKAFVTTGLSSWIAEKLSENGLGEKVPLFGFLLSVGFGVAFITNFLSNVAVVQIVLPIVAPLSQSLHQNPLLLMILATISSSLAFMTPVATPSNAIIFASGKVTIKQLASFGCLFTFLSVPFTVFWMFWFGRLCFHIKLDELPEWATTPLQ